MSFLKSAVNQVGRDLGKVISNQIFKDAHSTPIRMANRVDNSQKQIIKSNFEKSINFPLTHRPKTLINKINAAYIDLKNEVEVFLSNGFLSMEELQQLVLLFNTYNKKAGDLTELLEIDEINNANEIEQLTQLVQKNKDLFIGSVNFGIKAIHDNLVTLESKKLEEESGLAGLFKNAKIKKHNESLIDTIETLKHYEKTLSNLIKQVK